MFTRQKLLFSLALGLYAASACAGPLVYVVGINYGTFTGEFGAIDPTTGTFNQVGSAISDPLTGLVQGPNGNLLSVSLSGDLDSINPVTGAISVIGATGLGNLAYSIGALNGNFYTTDLNSNFYSLNTTTGAASLIGNTGIPPCPSLTDPDEVSDLALFTYGGNLYETFDGINLTTLALVDPPELYQINATTGVATALAPTTLGLGAAVPVNGILYAFATGYTGSSTVVSLNPANGNTGFVTDYDLNGFGITGAAPAPEPASFALVGIGIGLLFISKRHARRDRRVKL